LSEWRTAEHRCRDALAILFVVAAVAALFSIPVGNWGATSASAAYYYYDPGGSPATLALSPATATNTVGTSHTITATVTQDGNPIESVAVRFTVTGSVTSSGSCQSDKNGQCTFTYSGPQFPGSDTISAFADTNGNGTRGSDEPVATATKTWALPPSTAGKATGSGTIRVGTKTVTFSFTAQSSGSNAMGSCSVTDSSKRKISCRDVTSFAMSGKQAKFYGHATDNGAATTYMIQAVDNHEPGVGNDTFSITTASGYTANGTLTSGNIQVH
jgi:polyisoprenoid-binding protein YceI